MTVSQKKWLKGLYVAHYTAYYYSNENDDLPVAEHHAMIDDDIIEAEDKIVDMLLFQMNTGHWPIVDIERRYLNLRQPLECHTYTYNEDTHSYEPD